MRRSIAFLFTILVVFLSMPMAAAQEASVDCGTYEGVVCAGYFTDSANLVDDDARVADAIDRVVTRYGNQIAVVTIADSSPQSPAEFADNLGNSWGVGGPEQDGVVVLVDVASRRTEVRTGDGLTIDADRVAGAGNSFFGAGDFEGGLLAIIGSLEQALEDEAAGIPDTGSDGVIPPIVTPGGEVITPTPDTGQRSYVGWILGVALLGTGGFLISRNRAKHKDERLAVRLQLVDDRLHRLDVPGQELPQIGEYTIAAPEGTVTDPPTAQAVAALRAIRAGQAPQDAAIPALRLSGLVAIIDTERLAADTAIPLELAASDERDILEEAVQEAAGRAQDREIDDDQFEVNLKELDRLVASLRPHRLAADRKRFAAAMIDRTVSTGEGMASLTDAADRLLEAASALDPTKPLSESLSEYAQVNDTAAQKTAKLEELLDRLPDTTARPAVAAALADVSDDLDASVEEYEVLRQRLEREGTALAADGLDVPAIAALLLMNHDETSTGEFIDAYNANRRRSMDPGEAVELALAGLRHPKDIELVRTEAKRLGLPVSITTALLRRRDDGPEVYEQLLRELAEEGVEGDTRRTIAGILAISLEPAQATLRWLEARKALADLGLVGAYADVAAAFGASDHRGPRLFALAYAAQRQALARSKVDGADRFAPELAHDGTSQQTDSWTNKRIPAGLYDFDPFTLLYFHWVITKGQHGSLGWEPIYRDNSWAQDRGSWWTEGFKGWGGGGGFGGGSHGGGGSSWGGSWGGGGFGGFGGFGGGGGGGFSGGGGGSSW
jgi:hypothetical protein